MTRPLRIQFAGATYHVTSRGDRQERIFVDDGDRRELLLVVEHACRRFHAELLAYCLMGNHYHFVLTTRDANLSSAMRHINGVYTQRFNRRHGQTGHLFQGRYHAVLVDSERYLVELCRYVELNPVRAGLTQAPGDWPWSSYRAHLGLVPAPDWLDVERLHAWLLGREPGGIDDRQRAAHIYAELVARSSTDPLWDHALKQQIYLGDDVFIERVQARARAAHLASKEVPAPQRQAPRSVAQWVATAGSRNRGLFQAHKIGGVTLSEIAREAGLTVSWVSRIVTAELERDTASGDHSVPSDEGDEAKKKT